MLRASALSPRDSLGLFADVKLPHHAGEKTAGPIGPQFAPVMPLAADGIDRKEVGMLMGQRGNLLLGEVESGRIGSSSVDSHGYVERGRMTRQVTHRNKHHP